MRQTITIRLPEQIINELDSIVAQERTSRSFVVSEALRRYFTNREFQRLRGLMTTEAVKRGMYTDEDVFKLN